MPIRVTIQMPVECHEGVIALFGLPDVVLPVTPTPGFTLKHKSLFQTLEDSQTAQAAIMGLGCDLDTGVIFATITGTQQHSYAPEEFLQQVLKPLDENWMLMRADLRADPDELDAPPGSQHPLDGGWN